MADAEPPFEPEVADLPAERVRAGPAEPVARLVLAAGPELLPELLAECGADPESDDPPSVDAAATPCPTPTARPSPMAAAKIPLRAAFLPL